MWRYLKAAFFARAELPLVGPLPLNLMAVGAVALLGAVQPAILLLGLGVETAYLYLLAASERFQNWVDARDRAERVGALPPRPASPPLADDLIGDLGADDRKRLFVIKGVEDRIHGLYRKFQVDEFTRQHNRDALTALYQHFARLLAARASIVRHWSTGAAELQQQIDQIEAELAGQQPSPELRASRTRTLEILRTRLLNQEKKDVILAEIDSELQHIEQQFDLALENAAIGSRPATVLADTVFDPTPYATVLAEPAEEIGFSSRTEAPRRQRVRE